MNLLTPGIILYSFYLSTCMDPEDSDSDGDSMLPKYERSPMFEEGLGGSFVDPYTKEELDSKFPKMRMGKGPKDKGPGKPKTAPGPVKDPMMPTGQESSGASGGPGTYPQGPAYPPYPSQGQPGPYGTAGPYGQPGGYPIQTPGGYGQPGGYPGQGPAYPPDPYAKGPPYPPTGPPGSEGYEGGASGGSGGPGQPTGPPGPPSGPPTEAADGTKLITVDAKTAKNNPNVIVEEFRQGPLDRLHRHITPKPGFGFSSVKYDGGPVWEMEAGIYGTDVLLFPLRFSEKTVEVTLKDGSKKVYEKADGKRWKEKKSK